MNVFKMIDFIGTKNPNYTYEKVKDKLPSKPVKGKGYYDDNGKQGEWERYNDDGQLFFKGSYKNGEKDGYWEYYYYISGELSARGSYLNGKKEGIWEYYYDNGNLQSRGNYINGKKDGYW